MDGQHLSPPEGDRPAAGTAPGSTDTSGAEPVTDRHLFDRTVAIATRDVGRPLTEALGLDRGQLARLVDRYLPHRRQLLDRVPDDAERGEDALEEPDVRGYLMECRAGADEEAEGWWAAMVARRSLQPNHLWQDMGFGDRGELNLMLRRHFPELVRRNSRDMKWKKFFYRELCQRDGILICKSPICDQCTDFAVCFGGEPGDPLQTLADFNRSPD